MNKKKKFVLVSGSAGGIGSEVVKNLKNNGFATIGIDTIPENNSDFFIKAQLLDAVEKPEKFNEILHSIDEILKDNEFTSLINNAAIQKCGEITELSSNEYIRTMNINFLAPVILTKHFIEKLKIANGFVINILSIHTNLTKSGFSSYSASKSALKSFTKSLSIEFGEEFTTIGIAPGAIETNMLKSGFLNDNDKVMKLKKIHPTKQIGRPEDIANLINFVLKKKIRFLNGSIFDLSGGVSNLLKDLD
tara:strand:+ start:381 stop:1124 length:744 start_codon:yes stop_codon:yes gene_type:complete